MGLPNPFTPRVLSGRLALHPIAVCISPCMAATGVVGVMEKNERQKNSMGKRVASSQVKKKNLYRRYMNGVFKVTKPKLNRLILWGGNASWQGASPPGGVRVKLSG